MVDALLWIQRDYRKYCRSLSNVLENVFVPKDHGVVFCLSQKAFVSMLEATDDRMFALSSSSSLLSIRFKVSPISTNRWMTTLTPPTRCCELSSYLRHYQAQRKETHEYVSAALFVENFLSFFSCCCCFFF